jgi:Cdc6-like AAA superfamily ATPase
LRWLSPLEYNVKHDESFEKHHEGTGNWLFQKSIYAQWKSSRSALLWIYGIPGCGKTVLAYVIPIPRSDFGSVQWFSLPYRSSVIENLSKKCPPDSVVAYHYCQCNRDVTQNPASILRSIFCQLLSGIQDLSIISKQQFYQTLVSNLSKQQGPPTNFKTLITLLIDISKFYHKITIVIDGLDECKRESRPPLLDFITSVERLTNARILVLSRPEIDIINRLHSFPTVSLEDEHINLKKDMEILIETEFQDTIKWGSHFQGLRDVIKDALILGSGQNM